MCVICDTKKPGTVGTQHSLSESATCDWEKHHRGKESNRRTMDGKKIKAVKP